MSKFERRSTLFSYNRRHSDKNVHYSFLKPFYWLRELILDTADRSSFGSKLIKEYYLDISTPNLNHIMKKSIIILIIYVYLSTSFKSLYQATNVVSLLSQYCSLIILLICLSSTLLIKTYKIHIRITVFAVLLISVLNMLTDLDIHKRMEINYSPVIQLLLLIFAFIPFNLSTAVCISVLSICILLIGTFLRIEHYRDIDLISSYTHVSTLTTLSYNFVSLQEFRMASFLTGQLFLWLSASINACYMFTCNRVWRRAAFLTLGKSLWERKETKHSVTVQMRWIDAVMPGIVKDEYLQNNFDNTSIKWIYIKPFDSVSFLYGNIVGFTEMSSTKSPLVVVALLNDLFNRFDAFGEVAKCERIGSLGDCYYCVSGCPRPMTDHAGSCIEMGLGMCRIIKQFNIDYNCDLNMKIGIHTGSVHAAIIGIRRFRFDIYSHDLLIANMLKTNGKPGKVHISQEVYNLVNLYYKVENGKGLKITPEEDHNKAGMVLKPTYIKTYFVDSKKYRFETKEEIKIRKNDFKTFNIKHRNETSSSLSNSENERFGSFCGSTIKKFIKTQINKELAFIELIKWDPDHQIKYFSNLPVYFITLRFYDPEIEWHYQTHSFDHIQNLFLPSVKCSPLIECIISLLCTFLIWIAYIFFFYHDSKHLNTTYIIIIPVSISFCIIIIELWKVLTYYSLLQGSLKKLVFCIFYHQIYKSLICIYMTLFPNIICFLLVYNCNLYANNYYFQVRYFSLTLFSFLNGSLFISSLSLVKIFALILNFVQCIVFGCLIVCYHPEKLRPIRPFYTCLGSSKLNMTYFIERHLKEYLMQYLFTFIILVLLVRERETILRTWFYINREAAIEMEKSLRVILDSDDFLYNIIPRYVLENLKYRGDNIRGGDFSYATTIPKAGVLFACFSNFFTKYYREDNKNRENALKHLHTIVSKFDRILLKKKYKDVEKIKTMQDCYILASGLNTSSTDPNNGDENHLVSLMKYAFEMQKVLANFNERYIDGFQKLEIKIGFNTGPVIAGIIGSTKPMYDILGETVNIARKMYVTAKPGEIHVPHYVVQKLNSYFMFKHCDKIFIKGKEDLETYSCLHELENNH